jgi:hypothetical protein
VSEVRSGTVVRSLLLALLAVAIAFPVTFVASGPIISTTCDQILGDPQVDDVGEVIGASVACVVVGSLFVVGFFFVAAAALIFLFSVLGWAAFGVRTFLWTLLFGVLTVVGLGGRAVAVSATGGPRTPAVRPGKLQPVVGRVHRDGVADPGAQRGRRSSGSPSTSAASGPAMAVVLVHHWSKDGERSGVGTS